MSIGEKKPLTKTLETLEKTTQNVSKHRKPTTKNMSKLWLSKARKTLQNCRNPDFKKLSGFGFRSVQCFFEAQNPHQTRPSQWTVFNIPFLIFPGMCQETIIHCPFICFNIIKHTKKRAIFHGLAKIRPF